MPTMITRQGGSRKQYGLRALAVILLLFGGVLIYTGSHNFAIRFVGLAVVMVSVYLVQASMFTTGRGCLRQAARSIVL